MPTNRETLRLFKLEKRLIEGNLQIIACAVSGKTEFASARIANLVTEEFAKPVNIVAFTFTERAANDRIDSKMRE